MEKLFVYGTLKKGYHNHHVLGNNAKFIGEATVNRVRLYGGPGFPYAIYTGVGSHHITGELYEVPDLVSCDRLEGYPNHYDRLNMPCYEGVFTHMAWIYVAQDVERVQEYYQPIPDGIWK